MTLALNPLAVIGVVSAVAACGGAVMLMADRRARAINQRIAGVVASYSATSTARPTIRRTTQPRGNQKSTPSLLALLAIKRDRPDLYPLPWWGIVICATLLSIVLGAVAEFFLGATAWPALPAIWFMVTRAAFRFFSNRRTNMLYMQFPDALGMIVRSVRVGLTVQDSLRIVGEEYQWPTSLEFTRLYDEIRLGSPMIDALMRLAQRSDVVEYRFFAVALALQSQSGGGLSETLENLADVVRKRVALKARAIALASEARLTMYVLAALPFFTSGALLVVSPDYLSVLVTTAVGKKILLAGISLLTMGIYSMRLIIKASVS